MKIGDIRKNAFFYLILVVVFVLPLFPFLVPISIILLVVTRLLFPAGFKNVFLKSNSQVLLLLALFVLYGISILYSNNQKEAVADVVRKLSLFIFPFFLGALPYRKNFISSIYKSYIIGCVLAVLTCLVVATCKYIQEKILVQYAGSEYGINLFLTSRLSFFLHPSYMAMYINFAIAILFFSKELFLVYGKRLYNTVFLLFFIAIILLASKAGIIILFVQLLFMMVYYIKQTRNYKPVLLLAIISIGLFSALLIFAPEFGLKFKHVFTALFSDKVEKTTAESSAARILVWGSSVEIIKENLPLGTGAGDVLAVTLDKYRAQGYTVALERELNAHNQFLQTAIALGIPGLLLLIVLCFYPLIKCFKQRNYLHLLFWLSIILNFQFESMIETQAGVVFFGLWCAILGYSEQATVVKANDSPLLQ